MWFYLEMNTDKLINWLEIYWMQRKFFKIILMLLFYVEIIQFFYVDWEKEKKEEKEWKNYFIVDQLAIL